MFRKLSLIPALAAVILWSGACSSETPTLAQKTPEKESAKKTGSDEFVSVEQAVANALKAGDEMPAFELPDARNELVRSRDLLARSNLIVVFYRGDWCPYCNLYLKRLQKSVGDFRKNGGELVAISVEDPDESLSVAQKNSLDFRVLSDRNLELARKFGIVYQLPPETDERYKRSGIDLVRDNRTEKPELPLSATYIVDRNGRITYAFLDPDYKKRLEAEDIIEQLRKIEKPSGEGR